jgi:hypothetical protein
MLFKMLLLKIKGADIMTDKILIVTVSYLDLNSIWNLYLFDAI